MAKQNRPTLGFSEQSTAQLRDARERVYSELFGEQFTVNHELLPLVPHIDVYLFEPNEELGRDFHTLITGGMSDLPMAVPDQVPMRRAELVLYVEEPKDEYVDLLRYLARNPHDQHSWMAYGTTMNNGQPPQPLFPSSVLDHLLFLPSLIEPDSGLPELLVLEGDPVSLLWVVPITAAECAFIQQRDVNEFLELLDRKQHSFVLDESRKSYVRRKGK
jgi:hypothetical protein